MSDDYLFRKMTPRQIVEVLLNGGEIFFRGKPVHATFDSRKREYRIFWTNPDGTKGRSITDDNSTFSVDP